MILDERYFTYPETYIAGIETKSDGKPAGPAPKIISDIQAYIADNIEDYPAIVALLAQSDKGTSVIAKYIYFYYSRDHMTFNTVAGEKLKNTESSTRTSPTHRLVRVWNDMVDECREIIRIVDDVKLCPDFYAEIFEPINTYNL